MRIFYIVYIFSLIFMYFFPMISDESMQWMMENISAFDRVSSCVAWKGSVINAYSVIYFFSLLSPFIYVFFMRVDVRSMSFKAFFSIVVSFFVVSGYVFYGESFGNSSADGFGGIIDYFYCENYYGSLIVLLVYVALSCFIGFPIYVLKEKIVDLFKSDKNE
ncbi:hypothetical protein [Zooshikella ganghwensis]|uniref:hypothetical protein n=1 Tax=Zooshikella ganghwensis TaxID=202772 RepID=UPI000486B422|nr:hypothetical protein [Zooshikella ganghwensis]